MANLEALRQLARVLAAVNPDQFDMTEWSSERDCGTIACAAGWAAHDPWFNARGLTAEEGTLHWKDPDARSQPETDFYAIQAVMGLEHDAAYALFMPTQYPGDSWGSEALAAVRERVADLIAEVERGRASDAAAKAAEAIPEGAI